MKEKWYNTQPFSFSTRPPTVSRGGAKSAGPVNSQQPTANSQQPTANSQQFPRSATGIDMICHH
ncbi:MAG: hypothetical protein WBA89_12700 [Microcoleus sp.]|uniref:hypothetical protein n=1 Tax=Microcoleus sp. TaxID=44472 RepID=UPI003C715132